MPYLASISNGSGGGGKVGKKKTSADASSSASAVAASAWLWYRGGRWRGSTSAADVGSDRCELAGLVQAPCLPHETGLHFALWVGNLSSGSWCTSWCDVVLTAEPHFEGFGECGSSGNDESGEGGHRQVLQWPACVPPTNGNSSSSSSSSGACLFRCTIARWAPCGQFHSPKWLADPSLSRLTQSGELQRVSEEVPLLLLDPKFATGLDLSFLTHIFLLEPIEDAALLEQIVSRAYRLGATGPVTVETLHVLQADLPPDIQALLSADSDSSTSSSTTSHDNSMLKRGICDLCFRSFPSKALAEAHEKLCTRNPLNRGKLAANPWDLASIYREIKPPPPPPSSSSTSGASSSTGQQSTCVSCTLVESSSSSSSTF
mmetsp:Transcript_38868/g.78387  ORF Transcript_38868/g.78387 Transcript_38868/m.78387 type:complete len:374 (-) Transcript_38868:78-1199(-)